MEDLSPFFPVAFHAAIKNSIEMPTNSFRIFHIPHYILVHPVSYQFQGITTNCTVEFPGTFSTHFHGFHMNCDARNFMLFEVIYPNYATVLCDQVET